MKNPIAHLGDATITLGLLIALLAGADVRWIIAIWLALTLVGELFKALAAWLDPIVTVIDPLDWPFPGAKR